MKTAEDLQAQFNKETEINWKNSQGEPDIDYVEWLEKRILASHSEDQPKGGEDEIKNLFIEKFENSKRYYEAMGRFNYSVGLDKARLLVAESILPSSKGKVVFIVQGDNLLIHGCFDSREGAEKYINGSTAMNIQEAPVHSSFPPSKTDERREETDAVEFAEWIKKQGYVPYKQSEGFIGWRKYINFPVETTKQLYEKFKPQLSVQQTTDKG